MRLLAARAEAERQAEATMATVVVVKTKHGYVPVAYELAVRNGVHKFLWTAEPDLSASAQFNRMIRR